ncbi:amidase [Fictibacillus sp. S7]|uniref:amidase n=1 Tax=Fictibacillus sp. S7 TaxID=2212476 RepID=UPI0010123843|nr:amidase [Fictibacillus sp. S7]RXZ02194.1 amidase [Fictibacillus sp. S7]
MMQKNGVVPVKSVEAVKQLDIVELNIQELQDAMEQGVITSEELVEKYLERIKRFDKIGPSINALVYVNEEAILTARAMDIERKEKGSRGLLHGIPIILKDNYDTFDMPTTASSLVLKDSYPLVDSYMVEQLRDEGAVIIGKSNLHEFAFGISTESSLGGQTLNPYKLDRIPGGSSGGTAAAIAANFATVGLGTDTGCSVRNPAAHNNLFGLRPTYGLTSRAGIVPISFTQDTGGPIGRTVTDIAIVMDAIAGKLDPRDPSTQIGKGKQPESYLNHLTLDKMNEVKIGILVDRFGENEVFQPTNQVIYQAIRDMKKNGANMIEISLPELMNFDAVSIPYFEFKKAIEDYLDTLSENRSVSSLKEIIDSNLCDASIKDELSKVLTLSMDDPKYKKVLKERDEYRELLINKMDELHINAILYPTFKSPASYLGEQKWEDNNGDLSAYSGLPAISIPAGFTQQGIPVGLELLARPFEETTLIEIAYSFEQHTNHRMLPAYTP